ncbi:hypothetical protein NE237_001312 [Protea cynaroides]|uniref:Trichome birefringence-like N-terminal domain-containing protein n=1 Tax=Protea cynaroides TaxID=273540 RepID=A0A9Q0KTX2_9MAGN|nr:hypothetical protein NE237_001312 [Protea cynaroides]
MRMTSGCNSKAKRNSSVDTTAIVKPLADQSFCRLYKQGQWLLQVAIGFYACSASTPWGSGCTLKPSFAFDHGDSEGVTSGRECDLFTREWILNHEALYYTNLSGVVIHEHQNYMKYGRPDSSFRTWRRRPEECVLPIFNPVQFSKIVRVKSWFGDIDSIYASPGDFIQKQE